MIDFAVKGICYQPNVIDTQLPLSQNKSLLLDEWETRSCRSSFILITLSVFSRLKVTSAALFFELNREYLLSLQEPNEVWQQANRPLGRVSLAWLILGQTRATLVPLFPESRADTSLCSSNAWYCGQSFQQQLYKSQTVVRQEKS